MSTKAPIIIVGAKILKGRLSMIFKINNNTWTIKEVEQDIFWEHKDKAKETIAEDEYYFGICRYDKQEIWLWKDATNEQKRKTLIHELLHCYRGSYITFQDLNNCNEDFWCDIVANAFDIILEIVKEYDLKHANWVEND